MDRLTIEEAEKSAKDLCVLSSSLSDLYQQLADTMRECAGWEKSFHENVEYAETLERENQRLIEAIKLMSNLMDEIIKNSMKEDKSNKDSDHG